jgi:hypothetical protein
MNKPITPKKFATDLWDMMQTAIDEAVAAEREACAKACEQHGYEHYCGNVTDKLAETIRARGQA